MDLMRVILGKKWTKHDPSSLGNLSSSQKAKVPTYARVTYDYSKGSLLG